MQVLVKEATPRQLNWMVAKAWQPVYSDAALCDAIKEYRPTTKWEYGGPIIEREKINIVFRDLGDQSYWHAEAHEAYQGNLYINGKGITPLMASMRCYVTSRLGTEVEIPDEL